MKLLRSWVAVILLVTTFGGSLMAVTVPTSVSAVDANGCSSSFLGFPAWYDGLIKKDSTTCQIMSPSDLDAKSGGKGLQTFILRIALNVIGIVLVAVGYVSIAFILYAGLTLIKGLTGVSPGSPEIAANARKTILNACIGLVISLTAITIVSFIAKIYTEGSDGLSGFGLPQIAADTVLQTGLNMFYFVVGVVSVVVLIIAGYMFSAGGGEPGTLAKAKNMIYYAVTGLVVSTFAFFITSFIIGRIG